MRESIAQDHTQILPLIGKATGSPATSAIGGIIDLLVKFSPLIQSQIGSTYTGVKNIISSLGSHPATTADQLVSLRAFDTQVDDAWAPIEAQLDPDAL